MKNLISYASVPVSLSKTMTWSEQMGRGGTHHRWGGSRTVLLGQGFYGMFSSSP